MFRILALEAYDEGGREREKWLWSCQDVACVEKIVNVVCHSMMSNNLAYI